METLIYLPRILPDLSLHSSDNSRSGHSIWNTAGWGNVSDLFAIDFSLQQDPG